MSYKSIPIRYEPRRADYSHLLGKLVLVAIALLVGAATALYWSVNTMPLSPIQPTVYINRAQ